MRLISGERITWDWRNQTVSDKLSLLPWERINWVITQRECFPYRFDMIWLLDLTILKFTYVFHDNEGIIFYRSSITTAVILFSSFVRFKLPYFFRARNEFHSLSQRCDYNTWSSIWLRKRFALWKQFLLEKRKADHTCELRRQCLGSLLVSVVLWASWTTPKLMCFMIANVRMQIELTLF